MVKHPVTGPTYTWERGSHRGVKIRGGVHQAIAEFC